MSAKMEPTFYEDALNASFVPPESGGYGYNNAKVLKQSMTLNLSDPSSNLKPHLRNKNADILTSPDVGLLKLASPELERLIIQSSNGLITTTPTPTQFLCPKNVTDEQEGFAEGFVRALAELHNQNTMPSVTSAAQPVNSGMGYAPQHHINPQMPVQHPRLQALKEEPQTVPEMPGETPPLSPIDMESQERIKAERKRMRNRIAASKCRKRKLERIARLEEKVKTLKAQNSELASTANMLREQVAQLKQKVMNHVNSGCQLMLTQQLQTF
ncbi:PREDICTED: transcription factor AP-1 isoform X2 [Buceros rhinoceros silvestris]|uniref:transcription factor AP-1 isoform X2 n=1 Tax=Buceros rhinoceros silvestris TaxID=175836 RepID=UPI0005292146|nr:PREDICTED: transcription factor AP-1 isoform X2 [Buceros rhinoceros silvestris]